LNDLETRWVYKYMEEKETRTSDEKPVKQTIDEDKIQKTQDTIAEIKSKVEEMLEQKQKKKEKTREKIDETS
jgi:hypothetical protein